MGLSRTALALAVAILGYSSVQAAQTGAPNAPKTAVNVEEVASGLRNPWGLQFLPDKRMLITERSGDLRIVRPDGAVSKPVAGVPDVYARGQGGLLDVRLAPDFETTGTIYLSYAEPRDNGSGTTVAKAKLSLAGDGGKVEDVKVIFRQRPTISSNYHFGSRVVPAKDGTLFVTTGDRGKRKRAQDPKQLVGKVIRINSDGSIPGDNPKKPGWAPEIWSLGHRNIQGAAIDPATGKLWTVEHGARGGDELNQPQKGLNYGWPVISYGRHYTGFSIGEGTKKEGLEQPVYYWDPSIATSGLAIYNGELFPDWKGNILVGGLSGSQIVRLVLKDGEVVAQETVVKGKGRIRDVRVGPDGAIYALTDAGNGKVLRISPK